MRGLSGEGRAIIKAIVGREVRCRSFSAVECMWYNWNDYITDGIDVVIGMDIISMLGSSTVDSNSVKFNKAQCIVSMQTRNKDHKQKSLQDLGATFDIGLQY